MKQLTDERYERMAAAERACEEIAGILAELYPVRPRGMEAVGNDRYVAVLNVNRLERARRLVAQAVGCEVDELRPKEQAAVSSSKA